MLPGPYKNVFDGVFVFSPSVEIDSCWDPVKEHAKHLKGHGFFSEWDEGPCGRSLTRSAIPSRS